MSYIFIRSDILIKCLKIYKTTLYFNIFSVIFARKNRMKIHFRLIYRKHLF